MSACDKCGEKIPVGTGVPSNAVMGGTTDGRVCDSCACEHGEHDHGVCLDCGADRTEELAAQAHDRAKAERQDG